ncbi:hypothetical protein EJB05_31184 [Eragrostis curvula]|uniref:Uncharacterized protein n=1 Tax=Eragrostis curvula TaxID=38414 RepID=A0A5J9UCX6_9POAL|nr:hypothetical protein EJB05_31184 [Eragrostis curvula]
MEGLRSGGIQLGAAKPDPRRKVVPKSRRPGWCCADILERRLPGLRGRHHRCKVLHRLGVPERQRLCWGCRPSRRTSRRHVRRCWPLRSWRRQEEGYN